MIQTLRLHNAADLSDRHLLVADLDLQLSVLHVDPLNHTLPRGRTAAGREIAHRLADQRRSLAQLLQLQHLLDIAVQLLQPADGTQLGQLRREVRGTDRVHGILGLQLGSKQLQKLLLIEHRRRSRSAACRGGRGRRRDIRDSHNLSRNSILFTTSHARRSIPWLERATGLATATVRGVEPGAEGNEGGGSVGG